MSRSSNPSSRVPQVPLLELGELHPFPCALHKIIPRRSTMRIEKPMKEIAAGLEVASAFPEWRAHHHTLARFARLWR